MLNIKKIFASVLLIAITLTSMPLVTVSAANGVYLAVSAPSASTVKEGGSVSFTFTYSGADAIMNLTDGHIGLAGFSGNMSVTDLGNRQYKVTISNVQGEGSGKYITVNGGTAISKVDGSFANGVTSSKFTIEKDVPADTTKPVLTISAPSASSVVEGGSISFTFNYSDNTAVKTINLTTGHIGLVGFTGDIAISGTGLSQRTVTISNIKGVGNGKYITVNGGTAIDAEGNLADGKTSSTFNVTAKTVADTVKPVLTISAPSASSIVEGGSVSFTLNYSDNVAIKTINLTKGHIGLVGFTGDIAISGTGLSQRTVTISNIKGVGNGKYITVNGGTAIDTSGNMADGKTSSTFNVTAKTVADTIKPVLTISAPNPAEIVEGGTVRFVFNYSDNVAIKTINLTKGHIGLVGFTGDVTISGTGLSQRVVTISNIKGVGNGKYITVNGGTAIDTSGNMADGKTSSTFNVIAKTVEIPDTIAPVLKITGPSLGKISKGGSLVFVAKYSDNKAVTSITLTRENIKLNGFTADVQVTGTGLASRNITLSNIQGEIGNGKNITIVAGTASDAAGNKANEATSASFEIYEEKVPVDPEPQPEKPSDWIPNPNTGR